ncbi:MAG: hypothetical protein IJS01_02180 [Lentisphaeria bacterium]|nr:hypothetical protein [Lentisphaeria bacterium]
MKISKKIAKISFVFLEKIGFSGYIYKTETYSGGSAEETGRFFPGRCGAGFFDLSDWLGEHVR